MLSYNGFTNEERIRGWQWQKWAEEMELIHASPFCCITGQRIEGRINLHLENYYRPWEIFPLGTGAHMRLHNRFRCPESWRDFVDKHRSSQHGERFWFEDLATSPIELAAKEREVVGPTVTDLFCGPLFRAKYPNFDPSCYPDFKNLQPDLPAPIV